MANDIPRPKFARTVLLGGALVALLDGLDAVIFYGITPGVRPDRLFQNIARALIGPRSLQMGWSTVLLGIVLHCLISFGAATGFYLAARVAPGLLRKPLLAGAIYGLCFYAFMYHVVIPLSALPPRHGIWWPGLVDELLAHVFLVGMPVAMVAARSARQNLLRAVSSS